VRDALADEEPGETGIDEPEPVKDDDDVGSGELPLSGGETIMANEGESVCTEREEGPEEGVGGIARRFGDREENGLPLSSLVFVRISSTCFLFLGGCGVPRDDSAG